MVDHVSGGGSCRSGVETIDCASNACALNEQWSSMGSMVDKLSVGPTLEGPGRAGTGGSSERLEQLERAISILQAFDADNPAMTVSDAAREADISRAAARRILLTLQSLGLLKSNGRYFSLTPRILSIGWNYFATMGVDDIARPIMADVVKELEMSCSMATLDLPDVLYVARVHTRNMSTVSGGVGSHLPAHASAIGRVLLAHLDADTFTQYLDTDPLFRCTERTETDQNRFREELEQVGRQGWAMVDQELEIGLRALAVPLVGQDGRVDSALGVSSNSAHASLEDLRQRCLPVLQEAARTISASRSGGRSAGTAVRRG